ncbi:hypothetical protein IMZ31_20610 (plasmid) [Pontibacillus sp. ALD_SL1]|uniref:vWA domain-containing protein n=1 Tax=Pontibacillus sp. ALD_SL1 TaxID=2777185 RepID=UPI001A961635|nr:VWA-like domain-containing protein [Pontibacillus sp. ALD_SL1]QST02952.1 hypothetical protein IMZ31_20610 [Pontibacillus sp. ALD_SL1]
MNDNRVHELIQDDFLSLLFHQPFFGHLVTGTLPVINSDVDVTGVSLVNGTITLHVNKETYPKIPKPTRLYYLVHELLHIILCHHLPQPGKDPALWNIATDLAVNQLIGKEKGVIEPISATFSVETFQDQGIPMKENETAEIYYDILKDHFKKDSPDMEQPENHPSHTPWKESTSYSEKIGKEVIEDLIDQAYHKSEGAAPAYIKEAVQQKKDAVVDWRHTLRHFASNKRSIHKRSTWKRRNRRLGDGVMGKRKTKERSVVVAIDTSLSITAEWLDAFWAEICAIYNDVHHVVILECDTEVHRIYPYSKRTRPDVMGRGGTNFTPIFETIGKSKHPLLRTKPDALIILTDGYGPAPDSCSIPTLWCLTPDGRIPFSSSSRNPIRWGKVVRMM